VLVALRERGEYQARGAVVCLLDDPQVHFPLAKEQASERAAFALLIKYVPEQTERPSSVH
jgi:hypothetical protein